MSFFDEYLEQIISYLKEMGDEGHQVKDLRSGVDSEIGLPSLPFAVGPGASSGIVLKSDTFLELGSPTVGSCAFALYTERPSLVQDGRIRLIGPNIPEASEQEVLPFGQVIMVGGTEIVEEDYQTLVEAQYVGDQVEGFMVKSMSGRIWGRVSKEAAHRGFNFEFLGQALIGIVKSQLPRATAVEVLFVTTDKEHLRPLQKIGDVVGKTAREIKERRWRARGIDISDCAFGGHCGSCSDKDVCDEVRKIAHTRKLLTGGAGNENDGFAGKKELQS